MNRDAKIGVVVVLIIVGVLVIIWARGEREEARLASAPGSNEPMLLNNLSPSERGDRPPGSGGSASSGGDFFRDSDLVLPAASETPTTATATTTASTTSAAANTVNPATGAAPALAAADAGAASGGAPWEYTVAAGDALSTIAQGQLGSVQRMKEIAELNGLQPPYALRVGQKLKMPAKGSAPAAAMSSSVLASSPRKESSESEDKPVTITKTRRYVVRPEDMGIIDIAERQLGSASKWKIIADLNQLEKPFAVTPGQVLLLPD